MYVLIVYLSKQIDMREFFLDALAGPCFDIIFTGFTWSSSIKLQASYVPDGWENHVEKQQVNLFIYIIIRINSNTQKIIDNNNVTSNGCVIIIQIEKGDIKSYSGNKKPPCFVMLLRRTLNEPTISSKNLFLTFSGIKQPDKLEIDVNTLVKCKTVAPSSVSSDAENTGQFLLNKVLYYL